MCATEEQERMRDPTAIISATVTERKLSVQAHNSWQMLGAPSLISLVPDPNGKFQSSGTLQLPDYCLHKSVALVFRLDYRATLLMRSGSRRSLDFLLGWSLYLPIMTDGNSDILTSKVLSVF